MAGKRLGVSAAVVDGELIAGDVTIDEGRIAEVGVSPAGASLTALPGFVDVHVHGHGGVDFVDATVEQHIEIAGKLPATGVTAYNPTLMSMPIDHLVEALGRRPEAAGNGARILSAYDTQDGTRLWVITEAEDEYGQRSATTILLPQEY